MDLDEQHDLNSETFDFDECDEVPDDIPESVEKDEQMRIFNELTAKVNRCIQGNLFDFRIANEYDQDNLKFVESLKKEEEDKEKLIRKDKEKISANYLGYDIQTKKESTKTFESEINSFVVEQSSNPKVTTPTTKVQKPSSILRAQLRSELPKINAGISPPTTLDVLKNSNSRSLENDTAQIPTPNTITTNGSLKNIITIKEHVEEHAKDAKEQDSNTNRKNTDSKNTDSKNIDSKNTNSKNSDSNNSGNKNSLEPLKAIDSRVINCSKPMNDENTIKKTVASTAGSRISGSRLRRPKQYAKVDSTVNSSENAILKNNVKVNNHNQPNISSLDDIRNIRRPQLQKQNVSRIYQK